MEMINVSGTRSGWEELVYLELDLMFAKSAFLAILL